MAMTTRCPQCGTAFRVVPDQLRVRNGLVRCGECATVFDGRACLTAQIPDGFGSIEMASNSTRPTAGSQAAAPLVSQGSVATPVPAYAPVAAPAFVRPPAPAPRTSSSVEPTLTREPAITAADVPAAPAVLRNRSAMSRQDPYLGDAAVSDTSYQDDDEDWRSDTSDREPTFVAPDELPPRHGAAAPTLSHASHAGERFAAEPRWIDTPDEPVIRVADPDEDDTDEMVTADRAWDGRAAARGSASLADESDEDTPIVAGEARTRYHGATDAGRAPPEFLDDDKHVRRAFLSSLWGYGCVLGLMLLAAQAIYLYRTTLADWAPAMRPMLEKACASLGCEVGYARHINRIAITSSSLQPPAGQAAAESGNTTRLVLRTSLRNLYDQPQPWPALRLDLSDLSDTVVIRKIIPPEAYLTPEQAQRPFAAGAELNIAVPIEVSGPMVNGFQLHKFFP
ncbi:DUF3426 domain-containing protein [Bordetella sp. 02P26C-1]|uniref:DUF3426 domain-containing protein n=1 Tax=Bordetella sp. 02P26C-1 TaxID=2683195 RepID=UPI0013522480|nr:DUF3426 domain-containing protein [Bordetella sp. 02P26C-1]MVW78319.1 DUF3426 domain-containing protein [Bordetella sp. 02P26C-1]